MLPRWHILLGFVFTFLLWFFSPGISIFYLGIVFFSSFLIDFDHYVSSSLKTRKWKLKDSFSYHREMRKKELAEISRGIRRKGDFHLFHTVEFHVLIGALSFIWVGFFYIFAGMVFHSLLDLVWLLYDGTFHRREYFFSNWLAKRV